MIISQTSTTMYPVMESFYTLQGEGLHKGRAAYFIRLAGCDVGCVWCDVKESWNASMHPSFTVEQIIHKMLADIEQPAQKPIVVITGGEPLLHQLDALTQALQALGFQTNIETSGSSAFSGSFDWVCLSPKKFKAPLPEVIALANELKVVVFNKHDFAWAETYANQVPADCKLYLQPEWDKRDSVTPLIIDYIKTHPKWQLSLQIHKYINVP